METMRRKYTKPAIRFVTDVEVVLECLHEVYGLEKDRGCSAKNIHNTMIFPFLKMLESHCKGVMAIDLHEVLWQAYGENPEKADFLEKAGTLIQPYLEEEAKKDLVSI